MQALLGFFEDSGEKSSARGGPGERRRGPHPDRAGFAGSVFFTRASPKLRSASLNPGSSTIRPLCGPAGQPAPPMYAA
jgi:hypothetical protein